MRGAPTARLGLLSLALGSMCACCEAVDEPAPPAGKLASVKSWAVQLQGYSAKGAVQRLESSTHDMLVLDPPVLNIPPVGLDTAALVTKLKASSGGSGRGKVVLAYLNMGQAEAWRYYWTSSWKAPTKTGPGSPDFILAADPDGWVDNYMVSYWDPRWRQLLFEGKDSMLGRVVAAGFDGIYMDWVEAYDTGPVKAAARTRGKDAIQEMVRLIRDVRARAQKLAGGAFIMVAQNGASLARKTTGYLELIDAVSQEHLFYKGEADRAWDHPRACDIAMGASDTAYYSKDLARFLGAGKPVFNIEYACAAAKIKDARQRSAALGYITFVTRTPLDRLP